MIGSSREHRHVLAALGTTGLVAALAVLAATRAEAPSREADPPGVPCVEASLPAAKEPEPASPLPGGAPPRGTEPPNPPAARPARREGRLISRRFLTALLLYEHRGRTRRPAEALRATTSAHLARRLLRSPARPRRAVGIGRLEGLEVYGPFAGELKITATLRYPRLGLVLMELALVRQRSGAWRVARVAP